VSAATYKLVEEHKGASEFFRLYFAFSLASPPSPSSSSTKIADLSPLLSAAFFNGWTFADAP